MSYLAVTNFTKHQHYTTRKPPWVKFYVKLLDTTHPINQLPIPTRYLFDRLLLLAAEYDNAIPNDPELIAKLVRMETEECREALDDLLKGRWVKATQTRRRASKRDSKKLAPETETEVDIETPQTPLTDEAKNGNIQAAKKLHLELIEKVGM